MKSRSPLIVFAALIGLVLMATSAGGAPVMTQTGVAAEAVLVCGTDPGPDTFYLYLPSILRDQGSLAQVRDVAAPAAGSAVRADFNGDGCADLIIGVPGEAIEAVEDAGGVNVIYGSPAGLTAVNNHSFHQDTVLNGVEIVGTAEAGDLFGHSVGSN